MSALAHDSRSSPLADPLLAKIKTENTSDFTLPDDYMNNDMPQDLSRRNDTATKGKDPITSEKQSDNSFHRANGSPPSGTVDRKSEEETHENESSAGSHVMDGSSAGNSGHVNGGTGIVQEHGTGRTVDSAGDSYDRNATTSAVNMVSKALSIAK